MAKKFKNSKKRNSSFKEIKILSLILLVVLLAGSLLTYDQSDPTFFNNIHNSKKLSNIFGVVGANLSFVLFYLFGVCSFLLLFYLIVDIYNCYKSEPMIVTSLGKGISSLILLFSSSAMLGALLPVDEFLRARGLLPGGNFGKVISTYGNTLLGHHGTILVLAFISITAFSLTVDLPLSYFKRAGRSLMEIAIKPFALLGKIKDLFKQAPLNSKRKGAKGKEKGLREKEPVKDVQVQDQAQEEPEEVFDHKELKTSFVLPPVSLLDDPPMEQDNVLSKDFLDSNARRLERKLADFGVQGQVTAIQPGPVVTLYEFKPAAGVKISKIVNLADDLALGLKAISIRIIAPIPGRDAVGIEIPNPRKQIVYLKEILSSKEYEESPFKLPLALGKDTVGRPVITDLSRMPHLLVAGATGTGKSVCINAMVNSLLFKYSPDLVKFIMVDPKRIELSLYDDIPHLLHPVVTNPKEATAALKWAVKEMERRYGLLLEKGVRNISGYNAKVLKEKAESQGTGSELLPYIIIIIDELADLMMVSSKEVEDSIARLAQMARASGIHLILATQRPSVDVLTGLIKANFPARISFQVSSKVDSRTILDRIGAERLLGEGDMLFMPPGVSRLLRVHGAYVSEEEVLKVTNFLKAQARPQYDITITEEEEKEGYEDLAEDEKYQEAVDLVIKTGQASISMIQRRLRVGYNRAARMIELMERQGIVGPSDGIRPREVYGRK